MKKFGQVLRERREAAELSIRELAKLIDMSPRHLWDIEKGNRSPMSPSKLKKLSSAGVKTSGLEKKARAEVAANAVELWESR